MWNIGLEQSRMSVAKANGSENSFRTKTRRVTDAVYARLLLVLALAQELPQLAYSNAAATSDRYIDRSKSVAHNIVGASVTLGLSVIMLILMAIVAGYFVSEAPSNGAFSDAINQVESVGGTAFILLAVALLAVPVVAIVGYFMRSGLGAFIQMGGRRR
jgi:hypothetical protein